LSTLTIWPCRRGTDSPPLRDSVPLDSGYLADFDAEAEYDGSLYDEAGVAGNRDTLSNRGEKTIWDAENKRHSEQLGENGPDLKKSIKSPTSSS
jgi:hypothetical protein